MMHRFARNLNAYYVICAVVHRKMFGFRSEFYNTVNFLNLQILKLHVNYLTFRIAEIITQEYKNVNNIFKFLFPYFTKLLYFTFTTTAFVNIIYSKSKIGGCQK